MVGIVMAGSGPPPAAAPTSDEGFSRDVDVDVDVGDTAVVAGERWPTAISTCGVNQPAVLRGGKAIVRLDPACAVRGPQRACRAAFLLLSWSQPSRVCCSAIRAYVTPEIPSLS